jgi:hypothetical protein
VLYSLHILRLGLLIAGFAGGFGNTKNKIATKVSKKQKNTGINKKNTLLYFLWWEIFKTQDTVRFLRKYKCLHNVFPEISH